MVTGSLILDVGNTFNLKLSTFLFLSFKYGLTSNFPPIPYLPNQSRIVQLGGQKIGWVSAGALVVANMVGTGVFTSLGFQVIDIDNSWAIILLWSIGGVIALTGAFSYAEIGSALGRSGGEYHYLSELYHPIVGYLSGWISLSVGFAAPLALAAMGMAAYVGGYWGIHPTFIAIGILVIVSLIHSFSLKSSSRFQNFTTIAKVVLIIVLIAAGLLLASENSGLAFSSSWQNQIIIPAFAVSLVYVTYSYTGWNAAAYIVEEIKSAPKNLPKALIRGTVVVTILYVLLQIVFLKHASIDQLAGKVDVGHVVAQNLFGETGGITISHLIAFFLISSISAMVWVGPRVTMAMAEDYQLWSFLKKKNKTGIPVRAIWFQTLISVLLILMGTFEQILLYCGFILQISSALCVFGVFRLRKLKSDLPYRNPFHPIFPIIFTIISILIVGFMVIEKPFESLIGISNLVLGLATYFISKKYFGKKHKS